MLSQRQKKRAFSLVGVFLLTLGVVLIGVSAFYQEMSFFVTPSSLLKNPKNSFLRLGGMVQKGSYQCENNEVFFIVEDETQCLKVVFKGALPPLFKEGQGIVVEGSYNAEKNIFEGVNVFAKHDETYMPQSVVKSLKESGQWRPS
ncbi:MAG: cytochrome c maturation protein CcmE [Proteobacteria bacterium]|nr:cytochrome c maturation protein CcmE [Pseudomonadota bacterium]